MTNHLDIFKNAISAIPDEKIKQASINAIPFMSRHNIIVSLLNCGELITETLALLRDEPPCVGYPFGSFEDDLIDILYSSKGLPFDVQVALTKTSNFMNIADAIDLPVEILEMVITRCLEEYSSPAYFLNNFLYEAADNINLTGPTIHRFATALLDSGNNTISSNTTKRWFKNPAIPLKELLFLLDEQQFTLSGPSSYQSGTKYMFSEHVQAFLERPCELSFDDIKLFFELYETVGLNGSMEYLAPIFRADNVSLETKIKLLDMDDQGGLYPSHESRMTAFSAIKMIDDNEECEKATNPAFAKKDGIYKLMRNGYPLAPFFETNKIKQTLSLLIGSSHKEEVKLFSSSDLLCINAFSVLQNHFVNQQTGKQDRHGYIQFLTKLNEHNINGMALETNVNNFNLAVETIGYDGVLSVLSSQSPTNARDTLDYVASLVDIEHDVEKLRQQKLIQRWLAKNNSHDCFFHDYLKNKSSRDKHREVNVTFFQKSLKSNVSDIATLLESKNKSEGIDVSFHLPVDSFELSRVGRSQRHCVGSQSYADACASGRSIIFTIYPKRKGMKHGYTFEYNRYSRVLIQAEGFARQSPDNNMVSLANQCFELLIR